MIKQHCTKNKFADGKVLLFLPSWFCLPYSVFLLFAIATGVAHSETQETTLRLKYDFDNEGRASLNFPVDVFVNGELLGGAHKNKITEFRFVPKADGNNVLNIGHGGNKEPDFFQSLNPNIVHSFKQIKLPAFPGQVVNVTLTVDTRRGILDELKIAEPSINNMDDGQIKIINIKMDKALKSKIIKESPAYRIPLGQEKLVEDTIKVEHSVTTTDESTVDTALKLKLLFVETNIRKEVQKSISKSDSVSSEVTRSVKIIGDGKPVKVVWSELYRTETL